MASQFHYQKQRIKYACLFAALLTVCHATTAGAEVSAEPVQTAEPTPQLRTTGGATDGVQVAQYAPPPTEEAGIEPIDLTPVRLPERGNAFNGFDSLKAQALYRLPSKMFVSATVDNSVRLETNVFLTDRSNKSDLVYRVLPNVTAGYAFTPRTRVAGNFFMFRDQYAHYDQPLSRNIYSVGARIDHDFPITERTTLTAGIFDRELFFQTHAPTNIPVHDLLPSLVLTHRAGAAHLLYASFIGQLRWQHYFGEFQEGDQFYSLGGIFRRNRWTYLADATLNSNFGNRRLRGGNNNQVIILTLEAARQLSPRLPISAFVQAQPIFNMGANHSPGFAGVDFRLFGGLRAQVSKPAIFPVKLAKR